MLILCLNISLFFFDISIIFFSYLVHEKDTFPHYTNKCQSKSDDNFDKFSFHNFLLKIATVAVAIFYLLFRLYSDRV